MKRLISILLVLALTVSSQIRSEIAVGQWRTHFSFAAADRLAIGNGRIYVTANGKLFSYDLEDESIETYTPLDGLHGNDIQFISFNQETQTLLILYRDGNIDLICRDIIYNLPDYKKKPMAADKNLYGVRMYGKYALISTGIGGLLLDTERREISETFILRDGKDNYTPVSDFTYLSPNFYMVTAKGIFEGNEKDNLADSHFWKKMDFADGYIPTCLVAWNGELFGTQRNGLCRYEPAFEGDMSSSAWKYVKILGHVVTEVHVDGDLLILKGESGLIDVLDSNLESVFPHRESDNAILDLGYDKAHQKYYSANGTEGLILWALSSDGFQYVPADSHIVPNGPPVNTAWKLSVQNGIVYASGGGRWGDRYHFAGGLMSFENEEWISLTEPADDIEEQTGQPFEDILSLAVDPADDSHIFACSWGEGLYEFQNGKLLTLYSCDNSPLTSSSTQQPKRYVRVDGATFDPQGNFWFVHSDPAFGKGGIHIIQPDNQWISLKYNSFPANNPSMDDICFDHNGYVWINSERSPCGLFVFDTGENLKDQKDDRSRWISSFTDQDGRKLDFFTIHCLTEDRDGTLWIGTTFGPILLFNSSRIFDTNPVFTRILVPRNDGTNEADYLLSNDRILCIAVDGANRKWLGTEGDGIYLLSPDGLTTLQHFTTDNSPLPSNVVYSVAILPQTGEVFMGTEAGIVSYRGNATEPEENLSEILAFPNPVRPEYVGDITIRGFSENAQVIITDIRGNRLASGKSLGGQFCWDGCDATGRRVASGVYLVLASDSEGQNGVVCKIVCLK